MKERTGVCDGYVMCGTQAMNFEIVASIASRAFRELERAGQECPRGKSGGVGERERGLSG